MTTNTGRLSLRCILSTSLKLKSSHFHHRRCPIHLRRIGVCNPKASKHYVFPTNNFHLVAKTIADIYKSRRQIELFFKYIKQSLKIKSYIGLSKNTVMTQIWIDMCTYLLLAWIEFSSKIDSSFLRMIRLL